MTGHRRKRTTWRGFDPENRDDRLRGDRAEKRDLILGHLASLDPKARKAALEKVGGDFPRAVARLSARRGPNRFSRRGLTKEAQEIAESLAVASLGPVRDALAEVGGRGRVVTANGWKLCPPKADVLPLQAAWGLPLLAACSPQEEEEADALDEIPRLVYWLGLRELELHHPAYRALLAEAVAVELEPLDRRRQARWPLPQDPLRLPVHGAGTVLVAGNQRQGKPRPGGLPAMRNELVSVPTDQDSAPLLPLQRRGSEDPRLASPRGRASSPRDMVAPLPTAWLRDAVPRPSGSSALHRPPNLSPHS